MNDYLFKKALSKAKKQNNVITYRIIAIGFNRKGEYIGMRSNTFGKMKPEKMGRGCGKHAERELIKKYGSLIKKIIIIRFGKSGSILPIEPCITCQKIIDRLKIKVESYNLLTN